MARPTIASLTAEVARLNADLVVAGKQLESLRLELSCAKASAAVAQAKVAPTTKPQPADYDDYWAYVRAARAWCIAHNHRVVSYATREQWLDACAAAGSLDESHSCDEHDAIPS